MENPICMWKISESLDKKSKYVAKIFRDHMCIGDTVVT
jgi:hypothetical protein